MATSSFLSVEPLFIDFNIILLLFIMAWTKAFDFYSTNNLFSLKVFDGHPKCKIIQVFLKA